LIILIILREECAHILVHLLQTLQITYNKSEYKNPVISLRHNLASGIYIAVVMLAWVIQWFLLALSKRPNWIRISSFTQGWKQIQFPKRRIL
jgi:hypothetical protein